MKNLFFTRLSKVALSVVLSISLLPLVGISTAWADESDSGNVDTTQGQALDNQGVDATVEQPGTSDDQALTSDDNAQAQDQATVPEDGTASPDASADDTSATLDAGNAADDQTATSAPLAPLTDTAITPLSGTTITPLSGATPYTLQYRAYVQKTAWQGWVDNGKTAGTTGKSLRLEALQLKLTGSGLTGSIEYRANVQGTGWQNWVADAKTAGTTGKALYMEALDIRLTGELADTYDIYYRVHVQNLGWLGWAQNGEDAGSSGYGYRIEAVEVRLVAKGDTAPSPLGNSFNKKPMDLQARGHVQSIGWQGWVSQGKTAGTTGRSLRLEAFNLKLTNPDYSGSVEYRASCAGIGWQGWVKNGATAGTTGQSRQIEAVEIRLTGTIASQYDVYYRVHVANIGWMDWASNGATAGTTGLSLRIEALQVKLVKKGAAAPGATALPCQQISFSAQADVAGTGWLSPAKLKAVIGTTGQSRQLEAYKLSVSGTITGGIEYSAYVQDTGWQDWVKDGAVAGTEGKNKRIEAIKIKLTGEMANYYDIYYRSHTAKWGWLGWAKNGAKAGTTTVGLRMEAFEVVIVPKGAAAPGTTSGAYWETPPIPATWRAMNMKVNSYSSPTGWLMAIDSQNCLVGVYKGSKGNWTNVYTWSCSPGKPSTPTVKGTFHIGSRGYVFGNGFSCYYWTQFYGDYLFHSPLYYPGTRIWMEGTMGVQASHGCVRLEINNAKWIYDNIPTGTTVVSY